MSYFAKSILLFFGLSFNCVSEGFMFQSLFHSNNNNQPLTSTPSKDNDLLTFGRLQNWDNATTSSPLPMTTGSLNYTPQTILINCATKFPFVLSVNFSFLTYLCFISVFLVSSFIFCLYFTGCLLAGHKLSSRPQVVTILNEFSKFNRF